MSGYSTLPVRRQFVANEYRYDFSKAAIRREHVWLRRRRTFWRQFGSDDEAMRGYYAGKAGSRSIAFVLRHDGSFTQEPDPS